MHEKMTDEELKAAQVYTQADTDPDDRVSSYRKWVHRLLAHIAAVTAERDALKAEMADECKAHMRLQDDARSLRERVQALEGEHDRETRRANTWKDRAEAAESRLAAMRKRAVDVDGFFRAARMGDASWLQRGMAWLLGDDPAPLAPSEAFTHEKGLDAGVFDEAPQPRARIIAHEGGQPIVLATMPPKPDPASEAFASERERFGRIVRDEWVMWAREQPNPKPSWLVPWEGLSEPDREVDRRIGERLAREGASLLERRMGAMARALQMVREAHYPPSDDHDTLGCQCAQCSVRDALTDAPPVFTLEEVTSVVVSVLNGEHGYEQSPSVLVRNALTALRR